MQRTVRLEQGRPANLFILALPCRCHHPFTYASFSHHSLHTKHKAQCIRAYIEPCRAMPCHTMPQCSSGPPPTMMIICLVWEPKHTHTTWPTALLSLRFTKMVDLHNDVIMQVGHFVRTRYKYSWGHFISGVILFRKCVVMLWKVVLYMGLL